MTVDDSGTRLYIGNLPDGCRDKDLQNKFETYGKIIFLEMRKSASGTPYALVEFKDSIDAKNAVESMDGYELDGYKIRVQYPRKPLGEYKREKPEFRESRFTVEITGLPPRTSWQELKDYMRKISQTIYVTVFRDGRAEASFNSKDDREYAIEKYDGEKSKISVREKTETRGSLSRSTRPYDKSYGHSQRRNSYNDDYYKLKRPSYNRNDDLKYSKRRSRSKSY